MRIAHKPTKLLITGSSGTGKTTFVLRYLTGTLADRVLIYDWQGEFAERLGLTPQPLNFAALGDHADAHRVTVCDPALTECPAGEGLARFAVFCREYARNLPNNGTALIVVDELHRLQDTNAAGVPPEFVDVLEFGRRDGLDAVMVSQAPNLLHNRIRNQITEAVVFRLIDARAAGWLEPLGFDLDAIREQRSGSYIYRNTETGLTLTGRVF